uniref:Small ribosomal protein 3 n=1 Tax=Pilostyles hamiltonii TaxID=448041 RepID=A0A0U2JSQ1_9ROSI|nr:small ribosomal protein 3 [Pilostyles hamiltonii]ALT22440.1 small ribosomal protein 3 [Pilostyles hamiltonii]
MGLDYLFVNKLLDFLSNYKCFIRIEALRLRRDSDYYSFVYMISLGYMKKPFFNINSIDFINLRKDLLEFTSKVILEFNNSYLSLEYPNYKIEFYRCTKTFYYVMSAISILNIGANTNISFFKSLNKLTSLLKSSKLTGYKLVIKGNYYKRPINYSKSFGKIPLNTIKNKTKVFVYSINTKYGLVGLKLHVNNNKNLLKKNSKFVINKRFCYKMSSRLTGLKNLFVK